MDLRRRDVMDKGRPLPHDYMSVSQLGAKLGQG